jgi:hypothetical protein
MEKRGEVAYQLELPSQLSNVHNVFHVSQLKKYLCVPEEQIPMEGMDAKEDLSYQEYLSRFQRCRRELLETRESRCAMCNGVTIPKKKLLGKEKKN